MDRCLAVFYIADACRSEALNGLLDALRYRFVQCRQIMQRWLRPLNSPHVALPSCTYIVELQDRVKATSRARLFSVEA